MHSITTDILTLDEFAKRRKIGRTTIYKRLNSGRYQEDIDYTCDENDKKFFWPPKEFVQRDLLLMQLLINSMTEANNISWPNQPVLNQPPPEKNMQLPTEMSDDTVLPKKTRRKPSSQGKRDSLKNKPAFDI